MRHARDDYNRIQDPAEIIPEDEPVFLLRGQDVHASATLRLYANMVEDHDGDREIVRLTRLQADRMDAWSKHKEPDL